jgi:hypothetical protein
VPELDGQLELLPTTGPAADVYGAQSSRAVFRAGLVETAEEPTGPGGSSAPATASTAAVLPDELWDVDQRAQAGAGAAAPNGAAPRRPPGRPRRTEPLRAT